MSSADQKRYSCGEQYRKATFYRFTSFFGVHSMLIFFSGGPAFSNILICISPTTCGPHWNIIWAAFDLQTAGSQSLVYSLKINQCKNDDSVLVKFLSQYWFATANISNNAVFNVNYNNHITTFSAISLMI